ncbi:uncharacterized protein [Medicago truncatula]|uniref:Homeodomain transcription factor superfamily protein, putative n=2 Tax=Medicago truncatula TaxID=3880 RepID=G7KYL7_MEDTR|nr:uncharacterized protein LOC11429776 [Medicago truncatula]XP_024625591.1 uncharacterized protein LOC11429776 [Medicago truncatula]AES82485.2 homeodomain transcription factor superfamily protein, putative [Medicago truncatula]
MVSFEQNDFDTFIEHASDDDLEFSPRIGPEYQAEIPSLIEKSDQLSLRTDPTDSEDVHDKSLSSAISLPIPVIWSIADTNSFVLGLFIFGKNFTKIKRFIENKRMGEILTFYYGKFYETDGYCRWSECRKLKGRKCIIGKKLFAGARQQELLSRLIPHVSDESQDTFLQVSKSYVEGRTSLEEYISYLKSTAGLGVLVEAVSIGKEKGDLTRLDVEPRKNSPGAFSAQTCKALSSFGPSDIIQSLTGGFQLSKTKSDDLFWEAVWPRLLARGWHSEQPMYQGYVTSKDYLVFLIPGVDKFSRRKLVKGDHYFDSVSDVLNKVVAEPNILELEEEESKVHSCNEEQPEKGTNEDDLSDDHRQCYLKPRSFTYNKDHIKLMGIDTSLVHKGKPSDFRDLKFVPVNSVRKVEPDAAGINDEGQSYTRNVKHSKDMSKSIKRNSTKLTVIDTNRLSEGKLLKKMKQPKYPSVELGDASRMTTNLLKESKGVSSTDDSRRMVEAKMVLCGKQKINKTDSDPNKMVESQKNQHTSVFGDNRMKRIIKHEFNQRVISGDSNHAAVPIKRRRLTACVKAEKSHITENSSVGLGSDKLGFSHSSSFQDANQNVWHSVSHQQQHRGSFTASLAHRSVEENNEKSILKDCYQRKSVPCVQVQKCKSSTFNRPKVPSKSVNIKTMATVEEGEHGLKTNDPCLASATQEVVEEPLRTPCDVDSLEKQADINLRRQSTRNRSLTVRALECIANEFLHVQSRHKRRDTH